MASEKKRDAVVPVAFWWLSLLGGVALLSYAVSRRDPVIVVGQSMGLFVYVRNLMLIDKARQRDRRSGGHDGRSVGRSESISIQRSDAVVQGGETARSGRIAG